jgi:glycosyltransferase involved in cell wall biosynthesis
VSESHEDPRPVALFITPGGMMPVLGGGSARVWGLMEHFRTRGFRIELATANHGMHNQTIEARVDRLWLNQPQASRAPAKTGWKEWTRRAAVEAVHHYRAWRNPDKRNIIERNRSRGIEALAGRAACASRPVVAVATYAWMAPALDRMPPGVLRVLDTIDIQHQRAERARASGGDLSYVRCTREEEIAELTRADIILAIQPEEAREFLDLCPGRPVVSATHAYTIPDTPPPSATGEDILYVGNLYDPNVLGLSHFLRHAWPRVRAARPGARLRVCGRVCRAFRFPVRGVRFEGCVPDLDPYYRGAALVINPVAYGSGLKIKTVEALAQSKCLVCTEEGLRGLGDPADLPLVVADVRDGMADRIIELLANPARRAGIEQAAWQYARQYLTAETVYKDLDAVLDQYLPHLAGAVSQA